MSPGIVKVEMETVGTTRITQRMMKWSRRAGDIRPAGPALAEYLMATEAKLFDSQGASSGSPWSGLAEATKVTKDREGLSPEILRARDLLRDALAVPGDPNQKIIVSRSMFIKGVQGEPAQYGSIHQATGEPGKPVDLTALNRRNCVNMVKYWITRGSTGIVGV